MEAQMTEAFLSGGVLMWPLLLIAVAVIVLGVRAALLMRSTGLPDAASGRLRAILFWGGMSVVLGLLGTTIGIVQMTQAIAMAGGGVPPSILSGGIAVSLVTFLFGLVVFLLSAVLWFSLRQWQLRLSAPGTRTRPA
jgi:biopolymer transport protein ExbB/TolQ